jgi:hypothetical protein
MERPIDDFDGLVREPEIDLGYFLGDEIDPDEFDDLEYDPFADIEPDDGLDGGLDDESRPHTL